MKRLKIFSFCLCISLLLASCESNDGRVVNGNGTVSVDLTFVKAQTSTSAARIHHYIQNLDLETFTELSELQEDRQIQKGATTESLVVDSPLLDGFSVMGVSMSKDTDGVDAANVYYQRNMVTVTFNLLRGQNSKGGTDSKVTGYFEAPLDVKKDVDLGNSYFKDYNFGPKSFPAHDTTYDLNVATVPNFVEEKIIEGGTFVRTVNGEQRQVTVRSFCLAAYEFPQTLWVQIGKENPSHFQGNLRVPVDGENQDYRPVENLSWFDCVVLCNELSLMDGFDPAYSIDGETDPKKWGEIPEDWDSANLDKWNQIQWDRNANGYRLPTEAEWEFAARGGIKSHSTTDQKDFIFAGSDSVSDVAWNVSNSSYCTHQIGLLQANELELFDMSGNVDEWCWDFYADYEDCDIDDPVGPDSGTHRVKRGGAYYSASAKILENSPCSVTERNKNTPYRRTSGFGLRLARNAPLGYFSNGTMATTEKVTDLDTGTDKVTDVQLSPDN